MRKSLAFMLLLMVVAASAQQGESGGNPTTPTQTQQTPASTSAPAQGKSKDFATESNFTVATAGALMGRLVQGLIRKNPKLFLSSFDPARMAAYGQFSDRVNAALGHGDSFRARYHVLEATEQDGKGIATVEFDTELNPQVSGAAPSRKSAQVRFECERGAKGWRIVQFTPGDFFSQL